MRRWIVAIAFGLALYANPAQAGDEDVCAAFAKLADQVLADGQIVRIEFSNVPDDNVFIMCGPIDKPPAHAFCNAMISAGGMHGFNFYAGRVLQCLQVAGVRPGAAVRARRAGRRGSGPLTHLAARLRTGVRIDLRFVPNSPGDEEVFMGRYELVLWKP
jgi:hypothetical protein